MRAALLAALILATPLPASEVREWTVDAGPTGLLVEDHRVRLVSVTIRFAAGTWSPWVDAHDADAAFEIQAHDPRGELRRQADRLAASLDLSAGARSSWLSVSCLKEDLPAVLDLVRDVLANRAFDRSELKRRRDREARLEARAQGTPVRPDAGRGAAPLPNRVRPSLSDAPAIP